jgi:hypothetical protein
MLLIISIVGTSAAVTVPLVLIAIYVNDILNLKLSFKWGGGNREPAAISNQSPEFVVSEGPYQPEITSAPIKQRKWQCPKLPVKLWPKNILKRGNTIVLTDSGLERGDGLVGRGTEMVGNDGDEKKLAVNGK